MASSAPVAAARNEARISLLRKFHSKEYSTVLETYYDWFDIPRAFTLSAPEKTQAVYDQEVKAQKAAREAVDRRVSTKEDEPVAWKRSQSKWDRELQMRNDKIKGLLGTISQKSSQTNKLQEDLSYLEHELCERDEKVKYLMKEVKVERWESAEAYEQAQLARQNAEDLRHQLKEEEVTHEKLRQEATRAALDAKRQRESSLAEIQALKGHLNHLESEAYRFEVVENYYNDTLGKVEVALACKADFDYLSM